MYDACFSGRDALAEGGIMQQRSTPLQGPHWHFYPKHNHWPSIVMLTLLWPLWGIIQWYRRSTPTGPLWHRALTPRAPRVRHPLMQTHVLPRAVPQVWSSQRTRHCTALHPGGSNGRGGLPHEGSGDVRVGTWGRTHWSSNGTLSSLCVQKTAEKRITRGRPPTCAGRGAAGAAPAPTAA